MQPFSVRPQQFADKSKAKIICPCDISTIPGTCIISSISFERPYAASFLLWILFAGNDYTGRKYSSFSTSYFQ